MNETCTALPPVMSPLGSVWLGSIVILGGIEISLDPIGSLAEIATVDINITRAVRIQNNDFLFIKISSLNNS